MSSPIWGIIPLLPAAGRVAAAAIVLNLVIGVLPLGFVIGTSPGGLDGYVGHSYHDGTGLSGGQWQTVGLARALMRRHPLLLILDEPAAALDASAEHDLFERYASSAGQAGREDGGVTVLISHRSSTVAMAGLIAVLDHGRLTEYGTHRELMDNGGLYAELFTLQARANQ